MNYLMRETPFKILKYKSSLEMLYLGDVMIL